jgi:AraC family transcriptional regulator
MGTVECRERYGIAEGWDIACAGFLTRQGFDTNFPAHAHATITYVKAGAPMVRVGGHLNGKSGGAGRGQLLLYSGGYDRRWMARGGSRYRHFYLNQSLVQSCAGELGNKEPVELRDTSVFVSDAELWQILTEYFMRGKCRLDPPTRLEMDSRAALIGLRLVTAHSNASPRTAPQLQPLAGRRLGQALELIEANLDDSLRIADIAASAELGVRQFSKLFLRATGLAPHQYVLRRRLEKAKRLLATDMPASDIALACGFCSQQHFGTAFRRVVGVTPRQWRQNRF